MIEVYLAGPVLNIKHGIQVIGIDRGSVYNAETLHRVLQLTAAPGTIYTVRPETDAAEPVFTVRAHWKEQLPLRITREEYALVKLSKYRASEIRADLNNGVYILAPSHGNRWAYREVAAARGESWD